jgi:hypothetical protein
MKELGQPVGKISKITRIVETIAFQTDILALHAAIAAGSSGEVGDWARRGAQPTTRTTVPMEESSGKLSPADTGLTADLAVFAHVLRPKLPLSGGPAPSPVRDRKSFPRREQEDTF